VDKSVTTTLESCEVFYDTYFKFVGDTESPILYHRWCAVSMVAAILGRQIYIPFGHGRIYPNFYILLVGDPGTRKNTAQTPVKRVLRAAGYHKISPDRISPEAFLAHLSTINLNIDAEDSKNEIPLDNLVPDGPSELFVCIGEYGDFIGTGNIPFIRLLTNLWDNLDFYKHPKLHGKSIYVHEPTVNICAGITPQDLVKCMPIEALGQGYISRNIFVESEGTGNKITFPLFVEDSRAEFMSQILLKIKETAIGPIDYPPQDPEVRKILERIYKEYVDIDDYRFKHYSTRRFTHFLKLCTIFAAMRYSRIFNVDDCLHANTLLHYTELRMPRALGEFGKAKNSDVANNILGILRDTRAKQPPSLTEIWKKVGQDLNKQAELIDIMKNLRDAGKIMIAARNDGKQGYLPCRVVENRWDESLLCTNFLTLEEKS
jgi:hypothetical protein